MSEEQEYWDEIILDMEQKVVKGREKGIFKVDIEKILVYNNVIIKKLFQKLFPGQIDWFHLNALLKLVRHGKTGKRVELPGGWKAERYYRWLLLGPSLSPKSAYSYRLSIPGSVELREIGKRMVARILGKAECTQYKENRILTRAYFDLGDIKGKKLIVRNRQKGDRFHPLGLRGRKKLKDFFIDVKVPRPERDRIPLLVDREGILWVAGFRQSERAKVRDCTREMLETRIE